MSLAMKNGNIDFIHVVVLLEREISGLALAENGERYDLGKSYSVREH